MTLVVESNGPPSVSTLIAPKTSSLTEITVVTSTKKKVGVINGKRTERISSQFPAPSSDAASMYSLGTASSAAMYSSR
jgi:hypothetical protein